MVGFVLDWCMFGVVVGVCLRCGFGVCCWLRCGFVGWVCSLVAVIVVLLVFCYGGFFCLVVGLVY